MQKRQYYEANKERLLAYKRQHYRNHREEYREHNRRWWKNNPEKAAMIRGRRYARSYANPNTLTGEEAKQLLAIGQALYPGQELHLDHIVPLSRGGGTTLANIHAIPAKTNIAKGDTLPGEIYEQLELAHAHQA